MLERLKDMKKDLIHCVEKQMEDLGNVDAKELGEAVDMIKDLEEAIYYGTITKSMEDGEKEKKEMKEHSKSWGDPMYYTTRWDEPMMYYTDRRMPMYNYNGGDGASYYTDRERPYWMEGTSYYTEQNGGTGMRSTNSRMNYMDSRKMHQDKTTQIKELEKYLQELSTDVTELIHEATPEEKAILQQKVATLASKIR